MSVDKKLPSFNSPGPIGLIKTTSAPAHENSHEAPRHDTSEMPATVGDLRSTSLVTRLFVLLLSGGFAVGGYALGYFKLVDEARAQARQEVDAGVGPLLQKHEALVSEVQSLQGRVTRLEQTVDEKAKEQHADMKELYEFVRRGKRSARLENDDGGPP